jgi:hypothetical protein
MLVSYINIGMLRHGKDALVNANRLKSTGFLDGQTGSVDVDLNGDGYEDTIEYTFSSTTPPGTCDQLIAGQSGQLSNINIPDKNA